MNERPIPHSRHPGSAPERLLHPTDVSNRWGISTSWLAKARMRGDGPPYLRIGRSIRYSEIALLQWLKSRQRLSTSGQ